VQKAGIFKTGSPVWTIEQEAPAAKVLSEVAETVHAPLRVTGPSDIASRVTASPGPAEGGAAASETDPFPTLGLDGAFQRVNAALAVALTETFLVRTGRLPLSETRVPSCMGTQWPERVVAAAEPATEAASAALSGALLAGLEQATWPGRAHSLVAELVKSASGDDGAASGTRWQLQRAEAGETGALGALNVYLDGAHTSASMQQAAQWFTVASARAAVGAAPEDAAGGSAVRRVLVFGCSHTKDVVQLLLPLTSLRWDRVIFCPLLASRPSRHGTPDVEGLLECFWQRKAEAEAGTPAEADTPAAPPRAAGEDTPSDGGTVSRPEPTAAGAHSAAPVKPSAAASSTWCSTLAELWTRVGTDAALAAEREAVAPAGAGAGSGSEAEAVVAATAAASVEEALRVALPETQSTTAVFVTGSLYLVGDCLTAVGWNPDERGL
jgi:folylpolyglutamate synthase/dihydropteroate synthase